MADFEALRITQQPHLRKPVLIAGFAGWNDAGEAASSAVRFIQRRWRTETVAEIDPEYFYDFTQMRPQVRLKDGERIVEWPPNVFSAKRVEHLDRDVILLSGVEPHLAWRSYVEAILEICEKFDVAGVVLLGALLGEASHAKPVRVSGSATAEWLAETLSLSERTRSTYQGPTGIVGVLSQALREKGIPTASLWANIPFYVQRTPNPKGSLALLERLNSGFDLQLTLHDLEVFAARFEAQVAADIEQNPEIAEYARRVADAADELEDDDAEEILEEGEEEAEELPDAASMVEDLERFLREQRGGDQP
ncbi:MAG: PAC2 family protein [Dehalococcoidia bacterium]|nr:PAC2 family protein [Dehalococcoidia bacterium]MCB9484333.1 PAC2 family protein [Dehalococcoidia bacterium]